MPRNELLSAAVSVPDALAEVLLDAGVDTVFGIPGGETGVILQALSRRPEFTVVIARQETLASAMAETFGRLNGRPGVLIGQGAWIVGYGGVGCLEALLSSSPMLIMTDFSDRRGLTSHGAYQAGTGEYGTWDVRTALSGITKRVFDVQVAENAVESTRLALRHAVTGEPGPVAVVYSARSLGGEHQPRRAPRSFAAAGNRLVATVPTPELIKNAADVIGASNGGVMILGNGVRVGHAKEAVAALSDAIDFGVVTTPGGKGCFPEDHDRALGVFGTFGTPAANTAVGRADTLIAIGTKLGASDTAFEHPDLIDPTRQRIIHIDAEPLNAGRNIAADVELIGDAATVAALLTDELRTRPAVPTGRDASGRDASGRDASGRDASGRDASGRIARLRREVGYYDDPDGESDAIPIMPQRLIRELSRTLPENAIVTCDAGENRIFLAHHFQTRGRQDVLMASGVGPMGYGLPAALAAKLCSPDRPVVATTGDGGMSMALNGLLTAVDYGLAVVVVVFNNAALGWSMHGGTPTPRWSRFDWAEIARSAGCAGFSVEHPGDIATALAAALSINDRPAVVDVRLSAKPSYLDVTSPLIPR